MKASDVNGCSMVLENIDILLADYTVSLSPP
jgi:hypothetical protein